MATEQNRTVRRCFSGSGLHSFYLLNVLFSSESGEGTIV